MASVGIFGGTFNPIHKGHAAFISQVAKKFDLDKVIVVPTNLPPHKTAISFAPFKDRFNMCALGLKDLKKVEVCDIEHAMGGVSYTVNTLKELKKKYKNDNLFLIMGSDMAQTFHKWFKPDEILSNCSIIAAARKQDDISSLKDYAKRYKGQMEVLKLKAVEASSTVIRIRLAQGLDCGEFLSREVIEYIEKHSLYVGRDALFNECLYLAKKMLSEKRFTHSKMVSQAAIKLAKRYGCKTEDAKTAGILHDIMKNKTQGELLNFFEKHGIILDDVELKSPSLWHAYAGAVFAKEDLCIKNKEIISAIKYHTTAKKHMSLFEKIIYVADYISADRAFLGVEKARELAFEDIDLAMLHSLRNVIFRLSQNLSPIHHNSFEAYNELTADKNKTIEEDAFSD